MSGALEQPEEPGNPGQFHAREYYACQGIYYCMWGDSLKLLREPEHWLKEHMARPAGKTDGPDSGTGTGKTGGDTGCHALGRQEPSGGGEQPEF